MENLRNDLVALFNALNTIEVKGAGNVKTLANCLSYIEQMVERHDEAQKQDNKPKKNKEDTKKQA